MRVLRRLVVPCLVAAAGAGRLFGQAPAEPVLAPEPVLAQPGVGALAFAPDGKAVYFSETHVYIMESRFENGRWGDPSPLEFSKQHRNGDVFVSPDGKQMFFWSSRPVDGKMGQLAIWVSTRTPKGWSEPVLAAPRFSNGTSGTGFPVVTANGTLYFFGDLKDTLGKADLYRARRVGGSYGEPENLGPVVNTAGAEYDAYVAPDESFMVFVRAPAQQPAADLYISTAKDGAWTTPRRLGPEINSEDSECCPALSPDGKHFFFTGTRNGNGIYRIAAAALGLDAGAAPGPVAPAELFEEGRIARPSAFSLAFSPDGRSAYFAQSHGFIMESRLQDGRWSAPEPVLATRDYYQRDPFVSPDGLRLYFWSTRPLETSLERRMPALWLAERSATGWGPPRPLPAAINEPDTASFSPVVTASGTLYFAGIRKDSLGAQDIYRSRPTADGYGAPENLGPVINSDRGEAAVHVTPDERLMIFASDRPGGQGSGDLYISRFKEGAWTAPRNLGPKVNTSRGETAATVSPDGKYLYYLGNRGGQAGVYRVEMAAIEADAK